MPSQFLSGGSFLVLFAMIIGATVALIVLIVKTILERIEYQNGTYYQTTHTSYRLSKYDIGRNGEFLIYQRLKHLEAFGAKFLFNVYIPKKNGGTTEIDVLMITSKGIFVFESKNYSGLIHGSESQQTWYQTLPKNRWYTQTEPFYNPIMQNNAHIRHLKALIGDQIPLHSIVVFSDRCTLQNIQIQTENVHVVHLCYLPSIVSTLSNQEPTASLSDTTISNIYSSLYPYTQVDDFTRFQHAESARNNSHFQAQKCPLCNGSLVVRTATKGARAGKQFYGCSNYPNCKYIQNIDDKTRL